MGFDCRFRGNLSMRQYLDEYSKINEIRLELRHPARKNFLWVLVEGETDQKLYSKLINGINTRVEMVNGGGVEPLRRAVSLLIQETIQVIGIRDADFLHLDEEKESIGNLFLTDVHDAELMMLSCNMTFESLVAEFLDVKRMDYATLRLQILQSITFLGAVRWLNNTFSLELNFKGIGLSTFYDTNSLSIDKLICIQEIYKRSPNKRRSLQINEVEIKLAETSDYYNLCNGHDFEKAFALYITAYNPHKKGIKDEDIGKALRLSYRKCDFELTKLYNSLIKWQQDTGFYLF